MRRRRLSSKRFSRACDTVVPGSATPGGAAPASYTATHLADRILNPKSHLESERKQVTVLFADLKGSMELLGDRDHEEARGPLDPALVGEPGVGKSGLVFKLSHSHRLEGQLVLENTQLGCQAWTGRLLGGITLYTEPLDPATAGAHHHETLSMTGDLGMPPLVAHCHFGLGRLHRGTGDGSEADEHLTTATPMYRDTDMGFLAGAGGGDTAGGELSDSQAQ